ncbi:MAG TPA: hypothetical protein VEY12_03095 [Thermoplasmata archaeon]|nr:hypothetical protein [Thermoplasmata archaeon]
MIGKDKRDLGVYLFSRKGVPLLALPDDGRLPVEAVQVEGVLALAGGFEDPPRASGERTTRVRYDEFGILGMRGERAVVAVVSREALDGDLVPELERFLRRCDKRLRERARE